MIEKSFAKINGYYESIVSGSSDEFFDMISGCPTEYYPINDPSGLNGDLDKTYETIADFLFKGYPVTSGVPGCDETVKEETNLVCGHDYTVTNITTLPDGRKVILTRNPHGKDNWYGALNDTCDEMTDEVRQYLGFNSNKNDGFVWMLMEDYMKYFTSIHVGYYIDDEWNNILPMDDLASGTYDYYVTF